MKLPGNQNQCLASMGDCQERFTAQSLIPSRNLLPLVKEFGCILQKVQLGVFCGSDWIPPVVPLVPSNCRCADIPDTPQTSNKGNKFSCLLPREPLSFCIPETSTIYYTTISLLSCRYGKHTILMPCRCFHGIWMTPI